MFVEWRLTAKTFVQYVVRRMSLFVRGVCDIAMQRGYCAATTSTTTKPPAATP